MLFIGYYWLSSTFCIREISISSFRIIPTYYPTSDYTAVIWQNRVSPIYENWFFCKKRGSLSCFLNVSWPTGGPRWQIRADVAFAKTEQVHFLFWQKKSKSHWNWTYSSGRLKQPTIFYGNFLSLFDYLMIIQSKSRIRSVVNVQYNIFHGARSWIGLNAGRRLNFTILTYSLS